MRPSKRPKMLKTHVTTEVYNTIVRMAELNEMPVSACIAEMLEAILPGMKHTLTLLEEAHKLDARAKNDLARALEKHEVELRQAVEHAQKVTEDEVRQHKLPL